MRQYRTYSISQPHAYASEKDMLQDTWGPMTTRRASTFVSFVLGLVLVAGVVVLLSLLSAWFSPSTPATNVMLAEQAQGWTLSPREVEELACFRC
jgi:hypothetical protein